MSKVVCVISTDWHLKRENVDQIKDLIKQQCDLADKYGTSKLICLGDVFDERKGQEQIPLVALEEILTYIHSRGKTILLFPGNHDKTDYMSSDSFLDPYCHNPAVLFFKKPTKILLNDSIEASVIPYYTPSRYREELERITMEETFGSSLKILFSHIDLTGSTNNDGTKIDNCLKVSDFKYFDLVLLGHYHNYQVVGKNIVHIPSICQNNFGEDSNKGFTLLYDDLTTEIVKSKFREFRKMKIHVEDVMNGGIEKMLFDYDSSSMNIRFIVHGPTEQIKALDISGLEMRYGVDIQTESEEISSSIDFVESEEITEFNQLAIMKAFKEFCEDRKFDYDSGVKYLNKTFKI